jgi:hypothetical protein
LHDWLAKELRLAGNRDDHSGERARIHHLYRNRRFRRVPADDRDEILAWGGIGRHH